MMKFSSITNLARLIDGEKLREHNDDFDDLVAAEFSSATDHLGTIFCQEADGIYDAVMHKMKIEYVRDILKQARIANEKFLDLATELTFVSHKAFFELEALHRGNFTDEDYFVWNMHCEHENEQERLERIRQTLIEENYVFNGDEVNCVPCEHENQLEAEWRELQEICRCDGMPAYRHVAAQIALDWARPLISDSDWQTIIGIEDDEDYPDIAFGMFIICHLNEPWAFDGAATGRKYGYPDYWPSIVESIKWKQPLATC